MNKYFILMTFGILFNQSGNLFADNAQIYNYQPNLRIKAHIGLKSQNRINFGNYGIREIIGDDNLYKLIHDSKGHNIFIIPKVAAGEIIDITIVSNGNKVQDLSLKVVDELGKTIVIHSSVESKANS